MHSDVLYTAIISNVQKKLIFFCFKCYGRKDEIHDKLTSNQSTNDEIKQLRIVHNQESIGMLGQITRLSSEKKELMERVSDLTRRLDLLKQGSSKISRSVMENENQEIYFSQITKVIKECFSN